MRVEFELTRDDYAAFAFAKASQRALKRWQWGLLGALLALLVVLMALLTVITGDLSWVDETPWMRPAFWGLSTVLALMLVLAVLRIALRVWVRSLPRDDGAVLGWHRVALEEDGLHEETRVGTAFVKWSGVVEVRDAGDYILVFIDRSIAHVVPKRAFASGAEARHFLELAKLRTAERASSAVDESG